MEGGKQGLNGVQAAERQDAFREVQENGLVEPHYGNKAQSSFLLVALLRFP